MTRASLGPRAREDPRETGAVPVCPASPVLAEFPVRWDRLACQVAPVWTAAMERTVHLDLQVSRESKDLEVSRARAALRVTRERQRMLGCSLRDRRVNLEGTA